MQDFLSQSAMFMTICLAVLWQGNLFKLLPKYCEILCSEQSHRSVKTLPKLDNIIPIFLVNLWPDSKYSPETAKQVSLNIPRFVTASEVLNRNFSCWNLLILLCWQITWRNSANYCAIESMFVHISSGIFLFRKNIWVEFVFIWNSEECNILVHVIVVVFFLFFANSEIENFAW